MHHDDSPDTPPLRPIDPELALRASDAIIAISADAIISIDEAHKIIRFNNGAHEIFGYTAEEILGRDIDVLIPQRFRANHPAQIDGFAKSPVAARRMGERRQISGLRKNGKEFPAEASISKTPIGDRWIFTVSLRDVTERIRAEQAQTFLAQTTALLNGSLDENTTIENIAALALPTLGDWCVVFLGAAGAGRAYRRAVAVHKSPERDEDMRLLSSFPFAPRDDHPMIRCLTGGEPVLIEKFDDAVLRAWSDSPEHLEVKRRLSPASAIGVPLMTREGQIGAICFFVDAATKRAYDADDLALAKELARRAGMAIDNARLYAVAQSAISARDDVLAVVSHDLGNSLAAVRLSATVLSRAMRKSAGPDEGLLQQVDNIRTSVVHMERLIKDLLDIKRIDAGFLAIEAERLSVGVLLEELRDTYNDLAEARGVTLKIEASELHDVRVTADHARITQVFSNLLGNALKFTAAGGSITVRVQKENADVAFSIEDTGSGIPSEHLPYIFDRFWQAQRTGRQSIGLGLAIVKGIIDAHGGTLRVTSELGTGTTFTFTLPSAV